MRVFWLVTEAENKAYTSTFSTCRMRLCLPEVTLSVINMEEMQCYSKDMKMKKSRQCVIEKSHGGFSKICTGKFRDSIYFLTY